MEVFGVGIDVQQAGDDLPFRRVVRDVLERFHAVGRIVLGMGLAEIDHRAVVPRHADDVAFVVLHVDRFAVPPEVRVLGGHSTPPESPAT